MSERQRGSVLVRSTEETLRKVAARATHQIVLRRGEQLGMNVGCGFPKSGTVWLCQLMAAYLGVPYPRDYMSPIAMRAVVHAHWRYDARLPATVYVRRDGRDVMVSLYFHLLRQLESGRSPRWVDKHLRGEHRDLWVHGNPEDVHKNLPRFLEVELRTPLLSPLPWHEHVREWCDRPRVSLVSYEAMLVDTHAELGRAMADLTGEPTDAARLDAAIARYDFGTASGRLAGEEDRSSFLRKGIAGDWRNHFSREAGEIFDSEAGQDLVDLGYAADRDWWRDL